MTKKIDLNYDMGESFGLYNLGNDEQLLNYCTSANIACGFHASDPDVMSKTVKMAKEKKVAIGAHFGLPDLMGFGRRMMSITPAQLRNYAIYQIGALKGFAEAYGVKLQHVKPHGALYLMLRQDRDLSKAVVDAIKAIDPGLVLFSWNNAAIFEIAKNEGLKVVNEFYADRGCEEDEKIVFAYDIKNIGGSVEAAVRRAIRAVKEGKVTAHTGKEIELEFQTLAAHGDAPIAVELARSLVDALKKEHFELAPVGSFI